MAPEFNLLHFKSDGSISTNMKCSNCKLSENPDLTTNCMSGQGDKPKDLIFLDSHPSLQSDIQGIPFSGGSGRFLRDLLKQVGFPTDKIFWSNAIKCAPLGTQPKDSHWKRCKGHFLEELKTVQPKAIVTLGPAPFRWVTGFGGGGKFRQRGFLCQFDPSITVFPLDSLQPLIEAEGENHAILRGRYVQDLFWLRGKVLRGEYDLEDGVKTDYKRAKTVQDVKDFLAEFEDVDLVYCDLETRDPQYQGALFPYPGNKIAAIGFSKGPGHARTIPYDARGIAQITYWTDEEKEEIKQLLKPFWETKKFVGHNFIQFDQKWICKEWDLDGIDIPYEPQLMSHLLDEEPGNHGLQTLTLRYTNMEPWKSTFTVKDTLKCCTYLAKDVDGGSRVWPKLLAKLNPLQQWFHEEIQVPLAHISRRMEQKGVRIDREALDTVDGYLVAQIEKAEKAIAQIPEVRAWQLRTGQVFNPGSPDQLADLMQNYLKLDKIKETATGKFSTDVEVLEYYESEVPLCSLILNARRAGKLRSTYVESIRERLDEFNTEFIHPTIKWHGTVTGRPSGSNPNLFNIPRADTAAKSGIEDPELIKSMFVPREGYVFLQADYSQAELRVLAAFSGDKALTEAYENNVDVHKATAAKLYNVPLEEVTKEQRSNAKAVNFAIVYGKTEKGIQDAFVNAAREKEKKQAVKEGREINFTAQMQEEAAEAGARALRLHKEAHPGVWSYLHTQERLAKTQRWVETPFGRRRRFKTISNREIRQVFNYKIQSVGSGDLTHTAIVRCTKVLEALNLDAFPILTVYDSIVFEVRTDHLWETARVVKQVMENLDFEWLTVPMKVDLEAGLSWGRLKEIDIETQTVVQS